MNVKNHPLVEILSKKLSGIEMVPATEQTKMVERALKSAVQFYDENVNLLNSKYKECSDCMYSKSVPVNDDKCEYCSRFYKDQFVCREIIPGRSFVEKI